MLRKAAVKIAAHHLNKRGGVVIGDEVADSPRRRRGEYDFR